MEDDHQPKHTLSISINTFYNGYFSYNIVATANCVDFSGVGCTENLDNVFLLNLKIVSDSPCLRREVFLFLNY